MNITIDSAASFDILSIFCIKAKNSTGFIKKRNLDLGYALSEEIISQIGKEEFHEIVNSKEYETLKKSNEETFHLVDRASREEGTLARQAYDANMRRFKAKKDLQDKFFEEDLSEVKTHE